MPDFLPDMAEAGTLNVPGIAGLSAGVRFVLHTGTERIFAHERMLKNIILNEFRDRDYITAYFGDDYSQSGVVSFNLHGIECEKTSEILSENGIAVRAGLHCAPLAHKSTGTLEDGTVRASLSYFNKPREIYRFCDVLSKIYRGKKAW